MLKSLRLTVVLALFLPATLAPPARADGLPLPVDGSERGLLSPTGGIRYLTAPAGRHTVVIAQDAKTGAVRRRAALLRGTFALPVVAYDGTPAGISADGATLVVIRPRTGFPRARTTFAVMEAKGAGLRLRRTVRLNGDFSFDALSADGASLFFIQYISRRDPSKYRVRVYDLRTGRLAPKPVVDPRESPDEMNGLPVSRAVSPSGRWAYTLYDRSGKQPFIHALDTTERRAVCIDLHGRALARDPYALRLAVSSSGGVVEVLRRRRALATVDTRTFRVSKPASASTAGRAPPLALIAALACLLAAGTFMLHRRSRRAGPPATSVTPEAGSSAARAVR